MCWLRELSFLADRRAQLLYESDLHKEALGQLKLAPLLVFSSKPYEFEELSFELALRLPLVGEASKTVRGLPGLNN